MANTQHPDYHDIEVVMTDGTVFNTRSTWGKKGDKLRLDIDPSTHPAWTGSRKFTDSTGQLSKFESKFKNFGFKV